MNRSNVSRVLRARMLSGCSVVCLSLWMAHPTLAQQSRNADPANSFYERFFISLEGGWPKNESPHNFGFSGDMAAAGSLAPGTRNGSMLGIGGGGAFNSLYDWRAGWRDNMMRISATTGSSTEGLFHNTASARESLRFQTFDGEIGYRPQGSPLRMFAGLRALKSENTTIYKYEQDKFGGGSTLGEGTNDTKVFGIGPRAGFDLTVPFPQTRAFASLDGSVAAIFSSMNQTINATQDSPGIAVIRNLKHDVTVFNAEATAKLGYRLTDNAAVELGYRVQYFNHMVPVTGGVNVGSPAGVVAGSSEVLVHGAIAKLTIAFP